MKENNKILTKITSLGLDWEDLEKTKETIQTIQDLIKSTEENNETENKKNQADEKWPLFYIKDHLSLTLSPKKNYVYKERKYKQWLFTEVHEGNEKRCLCSFCGKKMNPYGASNHKKMHLKQVQSLVDDKKLPIFSIEKDEINVICRKCDDKKLPINEAPKHWKDKHYSEVIKKK